MTTDKEETAQNRIQNFKKNPSLDAKLTSLSTDG